MAGQASLNFIHLFDLVRKDATIKSGNYFFFFFKKKKKKKGLQEVKFSLNLSSPLDALSPSVPAANEMVNDFL